MIFTSVLYNDGVYLLELHVERLLTAAKVYGLQVSRDEIVNALTADEPCKIRLEIDDGIRCIKTPITPSVNMLGPWGEGKDDPWTLILDSQPSVGMRYKTGDRKVYDDAVKRCSTDYSTKSDVLMYNDRNEVTETTIFNVICKIDGQYYTPPLSCGLLEGVMRRYLLEKGYITERVIHLHEITEIWICNAVRGVLPATIHRRSSS